MFDKTTKRGVRVRSLIVVLSVLSASLAHAQIYVDSGINHFHKGAYNEALEDFKDAMDLKGVLTDNAIAKIYFFRGRTWLAIAEESKGNYQEEDPISNAYNDLIEVEKYGNQWEEQFDEVLSKLNGLLMDEADAYLKLEKRARSIDEKLTMLDKRILYLSKVEKIGLSSLVTLYLGQTIKQAGDLIFESTIDLVKIRRAKKYYEESLKHYELARYDDPFSKEIIQDLLTLSERLADAERVKEYEKLLELAGG